MTDKVEDKKTEEKEVKQEKAEPKKRQLVIETDGNVINIVVAELTILEIREVGRQLQSIK